jgi:hypothetical protein
VTESPSRSGVTLRVVTVRGGATVARASLAIGSAPADDSNYQVFAVAAGLFAQGAVLVLVRRVDLAGYPVLALAVPGPSSPDRTRAGTPVSR